MAAIWKGTLSFGLVTLPVEMRTAVRDESLHFRLLHAEDNKPVKYQRVCTKDGETVSVHAGPMGLMIGDVTVSGAERPPQGVRLN